MNKIDLVKQEYPKQYKDYAKEIYGLENGICQHPIYGGRKIHSYSALYTLVKIIKPLSILEIGSWQYDGSNIMAKSMIDNNIKGTIDTLEVRKGGYNDAPGQPKFDNINAMFWYPHHTPICNEWVYNNPYIIHKIENLTNEEIFKKNMEILLNVCPVNKYDLIFIDGDHSFEGISWDWKYSQQISREDTVIIIDDLYDTRLQSVTDFWNLLTTYKYGFEDWNANPNNDLTLDGITLPQ